MQRRTKIIIVTLGLSILLVGFFVFRNYEINKTKAVYVAQQQLVKVDSPPTVSELLRLVNEERVKVGVAPLTINVDVQKSAQLKADDMFNRDYFSHTIKGTDKVLTPEMNALLVANCSDSSENISWGKYGNTSTLAMSGWIKSEPHYKAMINPEYTLTGFGIAGNKIVEHFCIAR